MWCLRFFLFDLVESPRYLVGKGKDEEAVAVIHKIAAYNSKTSSLTIEHLTKIGVVDDDRHVGKGILSRTSNFTGEHIKALFATKKMAYSTSLLISIWGKSTCIYVVLLLIPEMTLGIIGLASTLYNNFLPFLWVMITFVKKRGLIKYRLASRGAHFGDASLNITYRNVHDFFIYLFFFV